MADTSPTPLMPSPARSRRLAAHAAGLDIEDTADSADTADRVLHPTVRTTRRAGAQLTSFTFHLDGLTSAVRAGEIESALNTLPGVQARVVYSTAMAWVTAPESLDPDILRGVFHEYGAESWLIAPRCAAVPNVSPPREKAYLGEPATSRGQQRQSRRPPVTVAAAAQDTRPAGHIPPAPAPPARGAPGCPAGRRPPRLHTARELITGARLLVAAVLGPGGPAADHHPVAVRLLAVGLPGTRVAGGDVVRLAVPPGDDRRAASRSTRLDAASSTAIILAYLYSAFVLFTGPAGDPGWRAEASSPPGDTTQRPCSSTSPAAAPCCCCSDAWRRGVPGCAPCWR